MIKIFNLESEVIFAFSAIMSGALKFEEFKKWIEIIISKRDKMPTYVFDLYDANTFGEAGDVFHKAIKYGGSESFPFEKKESEVFWGIASLRGVNLKDLEVPITEKTALKRMEQYPHVVERFRELFPFVKF